MNTFFKSRGLNYLLIFIVLLIAGEGTIDEASDVDLRNIGFISFTFSCFLCCSLCLGGYYLVKRGHWFRITCGVLMMLIAWLVFALYIQHPILAVLVYQAKFLVGITLFGLSIWAVETDILFKKNNENDSA